MWLLIDRETHQVISGPHPTQPETTADDYSVVVALGFPERVAWVPASRGFVDLPDLRAAIEARRDRAIHGGVETPLGRVDSDDPSIRNIMGLVQMASLAMSMGGSFARTFRLASNDEVPVDAQGMIAIGVAVGEHVDACYRRSWALKAEVDAGELDPDIEAGWPRAPATGPETPAPVPPLPA